MVFSQGGLQVDLQSGSLPGWFSIRVVLFQRGFHLGGSQGWFSLKVVSKVVLSGWFFSKLVFIQGGFVPEWLSSRVVFFQGGFLPGCFLIPVSRFVPM